MQLSRASRALFHSMTALVFFFAPRNVQAQATAATADDPPPELTLDVRGTRVLSPPQGVARVLVASPAIADVDAQRPEHVTIYGRRPGRTSVTMTLRDGTIQTYRINVSRPLVAIAKAIREAVPSARIDLADTPTGLAVRGSVQTPEDAATITAITKGYLAQDDDVSFEARVVSGVQVLLQVRVAEVAKRASNYLGFNWATSSLTGGFRLGLATGRTPVVDGAFTRGDAGFGSVGISYTNAANSLATVIDALREEDLVSILAEPNLTAISGSRASFVAGGEFPVPIVQGRADYASTTIEWKQFGIKVDFTPTVIDERRINIKVYSEVSELSSIGSVMISGTSIPSLTVRKVDTTVELASGQSFAIAGLFKNNGTSTTRALPFLGELPILGALFRSRAFLHDESELVVMITPYIVKPVDNPTKIRLPTDDLQFSSELDQILSPRIVRPKGNQADRPHLVGQAGFMQDEPR